MSCEFLIAGVDEAGRGPLAGSVYAAAVVLNPEHDIKGLNDSKKLTPQKREELFHEIIEYSLDYSIAFATVAEIESMNILQATFLAMKRALSGIKVSFKKVLVDGRDFPFHPLYEGEAVIKGDEKIKEIMAASILAKVSRDRYMIEMHELYPQYNFKKHKGYPTKEHYELIRKYGVSDIHRKSFRGVL